MNLGPQTGPFPCQSARSMPQLHHEIEVSPNINVKDELNNGFYMNLSAIIKYYY